MKHYHILTLSLLLFLLFSCSSETTTEVEKIDNLTTENEVIAPAEQTDASSETEVKAVAVRATENEINKRTHDKEIELINSEITRINKNQQNYTQEERVADWETRSCQLKQYKNENGLILKAEAVCGDHSWEIYLIALSETTSKLFYGKYLEKVPNAARPIVREFYSIGSMIPSENAYRLILDESGKEVAPEGYRKYSVLYEAAFDAFCYE
ncbi:MAG: hypothetical protein JKY03_15705 [Aureispira sp.]|nr:hypothetical protein [Aureispira sp.]